jgi:hypothetical protein
MESQRIEALESKFELLLEKFDQLTRVSLANESDRGNGTLTAAAGSVSDPATATASALPSNDLQAEFESIKDSVSKLRLPADLKLQADRQGIRKEDVPTLKIIHKAARYCETTLKLVDCLLQEDQANTSNDIIRQIFSVQQAQIKYLQDEYSVLLVQGTVDKDTARIFKALQKNTSGLSESNLLHLQHASAIAAASTRGRQQASYSSFRGRGRRFGRASFGGQDRGSFPRNRGNGSEFDARNATGGGDE